MLHGSETWPVSKENEVALQRAEMRMVRWMCGVTGIRGHNLSTTEEQVAMVWACAVKRRQTMIR